MRSLMVGLSLACVLALAGCGNEEPETATDDKPVTQESSAPADAGSKPSEPVGGDEIAVAKTLQFTGTTVDGEQFDGATLAGKPAVIWFWAPWCPTCQGQAANVSSLAEEYDGKVNVLGVAGLSEDTAGIKDFADDTSGFTNLSDSPGDIWRRFGIVEQSVFTVIDSDGEVVSEGFLEDDELNDLVADLAG